ncbi:MAG: hypothetical protein HKN47_11485 [Pirellulaceae bacterium]|nr:hypothetical protein [Pirellulaceae bacterium]
MWQTSRGDRTLGGAEAELICHAVDAMIDALITHIVDDALDGDVLDDDEPHVASECETGISVYDHLTPSQRIALLHDVTEHLLTVTESTLPVSAHVEATVAAIFVEVRDQVAIEIDLFPEGPAESSDDPDANVTWRQLVLAAHKAVFRSVHEPKVGFDSEPLPGEISMPSETNRDIGQWEYLIESLTDAVLWDRDYEMADSFLDVDPGVSQQRRRLLGIDDDYFTRVAPDPHSEETYRLAAQTQAIVRAKPR